MAILSLVVHVLNSQALGEALEQVPSVALKRDTLWTVVPLVVMETLISPCPATADGKLPGVLSIARGIMCFSRCRAVMNGTRKFNLEDRKCR